jgi:HupE / UreJ protein
VSPLAFLLSHWEREGPIAQQWEGEGLRRRGLTPSPSHALRARAPSSPHGRGVVAGAMLLFLLLFLATPAFAHTKSETHSTWRIVGDVVHVTWSVPDIEAKRLANSDGSPPSDAKLGAYLASHVSVLNDTKPCPRLGAVQATGAAPTFRRFEWRYQCPTAKGMKLHSDAFFDLVPSHVTFAQVVTEKGDFIEQLITKDQRTLDAATLTNGGKLQNASFLQFIGMGMMHIFTGIDHMSFILGFIILARKLRDLLFVVTGFTIGHSLTLALAVTGIVRPHAEYIDALIGLTIALVGAENIAVQSQRPAIVGLSIIALLGVMALGRALGWGGLPSLLLLGAALFTSNYLMVSGHLRDAARIRLVVTMMFGLIHGFGFAANLLDERLPKGRLAELILGFNCGVEIGQMCVVFAVFALVFLLTKARLTLPRPLVIDVVSSGLVGFGLFLFVTRGYATL